VNSRLCLVPRLRTRGVVSVCILQYTKLQSAWIRLEIHRARARGFREMQSSHRLWEQDCVGVREQGLIKAKVLVCNCRCVRSLLSRGWNVLTPPAVTSHHSARAPPETAAPFATPVLFVKLWRTKTAKCIFWSTGLSCSTLLHWNVVLNKDDNITRLMKLKCLNV